MRCHCDGCSRAARAPRGGLRRVQRARVWKVAVGGRRPMSHVHVACAVRRERVPRGGERSTVTRDRSSSSSHSIFSILLLGFRRAVVPPDQLV